LRALGLLAQGNQGWKGQPVVAALGPVGAVICEKEGGLVRRGRSDIEKL